MSCVRPCRPLAQKIVITQKLVNDDSSDHLVKLQQLAQILKFSTSLNNFICLLFFVKER